MGALNEVGIFREVCAFFIFPQVFFIAPNNYFALNTHVLTPLNY